MRMGLLFRGVSTGIYGYSPELNSMANTRRYVMHQNKLQHTPAFRHAWLAESGNKCTFR